MILITRTGPFNKITEDNGQATCPEQVQNSVNSDTTKLYLLLRNFAASSFATSQTTGAAA